MAKKKVVTEAPKPQPKKVFSKEEIQAALEITHSEYFMQVVALLSHDPENKDLAYVKVPVTTPDGGTYLVSILHVDGPKINLENLAKAAEAQGK
jgi:hypothetical protein